MYVKKADAYNRVLRRCAVQIDLYYICYQIREKAGSDVVREAVPCGAVTSLEDAQRWVDGLPVQLVPVGPEISSC